MGVVPAIVISPRRHHFSWGHHFRWVCPLNGSQLNCRTYFPVVQLIGLEYSVLNLTQVGDHVGVGVISDSCQDCGECGKGEEQVVAAAASGCMM